MTPVHNPSLPPVQIAAGERVAKPNYAAIAREAGLHLRIDGKFGNPNYESVSGSWPALLKFAELVSTAPTTGSAPFNPDDCKGYWIQGGVKHYVGYPIVADPQLVDLNKGCQSPEQVAPPANAPAASVLTDEQIIALNAGEVFFSESPTRYPEAGHGTQYHAGAPGVIKFARAVIAASMGGDKA